MSIPLDVELRGYSETGHASPSKHVILGWSEQVSVIMAKLEAMEQLLEECRKAINSVPDKFVFGVGGDGLTHWYLADELLSNIAAAQQEER